MEDRSTEVSIVVTSAWGLCIVVVVDVDRQ
jgi:hypothetical protein